jgi:hypothetical protein
MHARLQRHHSVRSKASTKQTRTGLNPDFRALLRLRVRSPSGDRYVAGRGRCSPGLRPLRGLPDQPLGLRPPLMRLPSDRLRPLSKENVQKPTAQPRYRVSIRLTLRGSPKRASSLPEVFHLIRLPPGFPPALASKPANTISNAPCKQETFIGIGCHKL